MNRPWIAVSAALLLAAPAAQAGVGQGDIEAGVSISLTNQEQEVDNGFGGTTTTKTDFGSVNLNGGYFFTDMVEFKLAINMLVSTDITTGTINPGADFLFATKDMVPFAGASYGLAVGDLDETDFLEFHGGVKYFFRERMSIEAKLARFEPLDSDFDVGHTDLTAGFNVYF